MRNRYVLYDGLFKLVKRLQFITFIACCIVELELGLADDAVKKFEDALALESVNDTLRKVAVLGLGQSLLSLAKRDAADGKASSAFEKINRALDVFNDVGPNDAFCLLKVHGDLYSLGTILPPYVFDCANDIGNDTSMSQLEFIAKGEEVYRWAESMVMAPAPEIKSTLQASAICDIASNILSRAQLLSLHDSQGVHQELTSTCNDEFELAANEFRRALDVDPLHPFAWCGLGCAVMHSDPLLAQHAFARSVELDPLSPYAYANLSFLYSARHQSQASSDVSKALTQVADTPMMWINLAFLLEWQAAQNIPEARTFLSQAADAYRAALQVAQLPVALYGLGLTCRFDAHSNGFSVESAASIQEYRFLVGDETDVSAQLWQGVTQMEYGLNYNTSQSAELFQDGKSKVEAVISSLTSENAASSHLDTLLLQQMVNTARWPHMSPSMDTVPTDTVTHLSRMLLYEPQRADVWVRLAKALVQELNSNAHLEEEHARVLQAATTAAQRAVHLLHAEWTHRGKRSLSSSVSVRASDLADAYSLHHVLVRMQNPKTACDPGTTRNWQRALIIDPGNRLAREILQASLVA
jgi:tetratricopeptide (TPR) repeat protein